MKSCFGQQRLTIRTVISIEPVLNWINQNGSNTIKFDVYVKFISKLIVYDSTIIKLQRINLPNESTTMQFNLIYKWNNSAPSKTTYTITWSKTLARWSKKFFSDLYYKDLEAVPAQFNQSKWIKYN